jgi:hypothetical protein
VHFILLSFQDWDEHSVMTTSKSVDQSAVPF